MRRLALSFSAPHGASATDRSNFRAVQLDGVGIGVTNTLSVFLPVLLIRLGATGLEVGLLTALPALTGLVTALLVGPWLDRKSDILPWYIGSRTAGILLSVACSGAAFLLPPHWVVMAILVLAGLATIPQVILDVTFSLVMNSAAGPHGRYALLSRRWAVLGLANAVSVWGAGWILHRISFPTNYLTVFTMIGAIGIASQYFAAQLVLAPRQCLEQPNVIRGRDSVTTALSKVLKHRGFVRFAAARLVFQLGLFLALPLFPLYFVRAAGASDADIGLLTTGQSLAMLVGYWFWTQHAKNRSRRAVLLWATAGQAIYPLVLSMNTNLVWVSVAAVMSGIFMAGLELAMFDELFERMPADRPASFVAFANFLRYFAMLIGPLIGTIIADAYSIAAGLCIAAAVRLLGHGLIRWWLEPQARAAA